MMDTSRVMSKRCSLSILDIFISQKTPHGYRIELSTELISNFNESEKSRKLFFKAEKRFYVDMVCKLQIYSNK